MKELLINQIAPILATAIVAILVATIKTIGGPAIELLKKMKEEVEQRIIVSGHETDLNTAKEVWNTIEEKFRITENAKQILGSKSDEFNKLLLSKIPGLTQTNLEDLRQAIAGEVNKDKAPVVVDDTTIQITKLQETNAQLEVDKANLQAKIDQFNNILNPVVTVQS